LHFCTALLSSCKGRPISYNGDDDADDADKIIIVFDPGKCWKHVMLLLWPVYMQACMLFL